MLYNAHIYIIRAQFLLGYFPNVIYIDKIQLRFAEMYKAQLKIHYISDVTCEYLQSQLLSVQLIYVRAHVCVSMILTEPCFPKHD